MFHLLFPWCIYKIYHSLNFIGKLVTECSRIRGIYSAPLIPAVIWSFLWNPVDSRGMKFGRRPAIFIIPVPDHSSGIWVFWNWARNVLWNVWEQNATESGSLFVQHMFVDHMWHVTTITTASTTITTTTAMHLPTPTPTTTMMTMPTMTTTPTTTTTTTTTTMSTTTTTTTTTTTMPTTTTPRFWSVLISVSLAPSSAKLAGKGLRNDPLRSVQRWWECSTLISSLRTESLKSIYALSDAEQNWVMHQ